MDIPDFQAHKIVDALRRCAAASRCSPAIIGYDGQVLSYEALLHQVERIGSVLTGSGLTAQDRIAIVASSTADMAVAFLGIAAVAGCAPLNPSYTAAEFEFFLGDLRPRLVIVEHGIAPQIYDVARSLKIAVWEFSPGSALSGNFDLHGGDVGSVSPAPALGADETPALILHTSGTTSRQKMVPLTQRNLCLSAASIARSLHLSPNDRCLSVMPLFHIHGLVGTVLSTMVSGGTLKCSAGGFSATALLDELTRSSLSWYSAVPAMHAAVLAVLEREHRPSPRHSLRFIRSCSAPLPPRTLHRLEECFGVPVVEAYGMTEAAHQIACNPLPPRMRKPGTVGIATGTEIAIVDADGTFLDPGATGEIVVRGGGVTKGYLGDAAAGREAFIRGWLRTGDLGSMDPEGYLSISSRIKEIINRGGEKILPREIEEVLMSYPGIAEVVAFAVPDEHLGEVVGAAMVLRPGVAAPSAPSLRQFAAARLAAFKLPRDFVFVSEIPRGPTGKPQRIGLAARLNIPKPERPSEGCEAAATPAITVEAMLIGIWSRILRLQDVDIHEDFFLLGGDSLSAQTMLREVEEQQGVVLTMGDLLNAPTISLLTERIARARPIEAPPRIAVIQPGSSSTPAFFGIGAGPRFRELAKLLGKDQPFIAPVYPPPAELPFPCRIEDIARYHVGSIRKVQPAGPYFLGGWCVDGVVAYEVAQQLKSAGELVALLVLFDTSFNLDADSTSALGLSFLQVQAVVSSLGFHLWAAITQPRLKSIVHYVIQHASRIADRIRYRYLYVRFRFAGGRKAPGDWRTVAAVQHRIAAQYKPELYTGDVVVLHRSVRWRAGPRVLQFWRRLVMGALEVHQIPGDHGEMFDQPNVMVTAAKLRSSLAAKRLNEVPTPPR